MWVTFSHPHLLNSQSQNHSISTVLTTCHIATFPFSSLFSPNLRFHYLPSPISTFDMAHLPKWHLRCHSLPSPTSTRSDSLTVVSICKPPPHLISVIFWNAGAIIYLSLAIHCPACTPSCGTTLPSSKMQVSLSPLPNLNSPPRSQLLTQPTFQNSGSILSQSQVSFLDASYALSQLSPIISSYSCPQSPQ